MPRYHGISDGSKGRGNIWYLAGVLRWLDGTSKFRWIDGNVSYFNDSNHTSLNFSSNVVTGTNRIVINYAKTASKVISMIAVPDEAYAGNSGNNPIILGLSVGLSSADIYPFDTVTGASINPNDMNTTNYPNSNIWVYGVMEGFA